MNSPPIMIRLLIAAGVLGVIATLFVALFMLSGVVGVPAVAGSATYALGLALLLALTQNAAPRTGPIWGVMIMIPLPAALVVFFGLRAFGL